MSTVYFLHWNQSILAEAPIFKFLNCIILKAISLGSIIKSLDAIIKRFLTRQRACTSLNSMFTCELINDFVRIVASPFQLQCESRYV